MHATWIISIFRKPLILFHIIGCLNQRQQGFLMKPWGKKKEIGERTKQKVENEAEWKIDRRWGYFQRTREEMQMLQL